MCCPGPRNSALLPLIAVAGEAVPARGALCVAPLVHEDLGFAGHWVLGPSFLCTEAPLFLQAADGMQPLKMHAALWPP